MTQIELLKKYAELTEKAEDIRHELDFIKSELELSVQETNAPLSAYGLIAHMKPGRKSIDHERATNAEVLKHHKAGGDHDRVFFIRELIDANSTTKVTVKWAEVTKRAQIDTAPFVTEGEPVFVIEPVK